MRLRLLLFLLLGTFLTARGQEVAISEISAAGQSVLADEEGKYPDWIEIRNNSERSINLKGWGLTNRNEEAIPGVSPGASITPGPAPTWTFPAVTLKPGKFLVVMASGKDRRRSSGRLHTNFSLDAEGEYLALVRPNRTVAHALSYPAQVPYLTYTGTGREGHFLTEPTPGAENSGTFAALVKAPEFDHQRGFYNTPFPLVLASDTPGVVIRYTLDGSVPSATNGTDYTAPLSIRSTSVVRAIALKEDHAPSPVITRSFFFVADVIQQSPDGRAPEGWPESWGENQVDYGMDPRITGSPEYGPTMREALKSLPVLSIVTDLPNLFDPSTGIYANSSQTGAEWERPISIELVEPDGSKGFQANAGIRIRGGASRSSGNPKHSFHLYFRGKYGAEELDYPLFGPDGAQTSDRVDLRCDQVASWHFTQDPNADMIRDQVARDTQLALGQPSTRGDFYHVYINGQYWGLYNTQERISGAFAARYFGGDERDYDVVRMDNNVGQTAAVDGTFDAWVRVHNAGKKGLATNAAYQKIQGNNPDGTRNPAFERLLDVDSVIDYMLTGLYQGIQDTPAAGGTQNNWFGVKSRTGEFGWRFFVYDNELSIYDVNDRLIEPEPNAKPYDTLPPEQTNVWYLWEAMRHNAEFRLRVADHIQRAFFNGGPLTAAEAIKRFKKRAHEVDRAVIAESARWGDTFGGLGPFFGPGDEVPPGEPPTEERVPFTYADWAKTTYERELRDYFPQRSDVVLQQLKDAHLYPETAAPEFSQFGGNVPAGYTLSITNPGREGVIYYTTDGSDPRKFGGQVAAAAVPYTAPITVGFLPLPESATPRPFISIQDFILINVVFSQPGQRTFKARIKRGNEWSALVSADFTPTVDLSGLRITEIDYHPLPRRGYSSDDLEFLELKNTGATTIDLSGFQFTSGIRYTFPPNTYLYPGTFQVLVRNAVAFEATHQRGMVLIYIPGQNQYPPAYKGVYEGKLDNDGDSIVLAAPDGSPVLKVEYQDRSPWPLAADGLGFSLVPANDGDPGQASSWRASSEFYGSPGYDDPAVTIPRVLVNEVLSNPTTGPTFIELFNPESTPADISGWWLTDDPAHPKKYRIPSGTTLPSQGCVVFDSNQFAPVLVPIDPNPNMVVAYNPLQTITASSFMSLSRGDVWLFSAQAADGNLTGYAHGFHFLASDPDVSFGRHVNSVGDEQFVAQSATTLGAVNASPALPAVVLNEIHYQPAPGSDEFVELRNTTAGDVALHGWQLDGLAFTFPGGANILAHGLAVVTATEPAAFRSKYGVPLEVPVFGPATGTLQNSGERLTLLKPASVAGRFIVADTIRYNDRSPWPPSAAGSGPSLQRKTGAVHGDDPIAWFASGPTPGGGSVFNAPPTVSISAPTNEATFVQPAEIAIAVEATDDDGEVASVEYFADGLSIGSSLDKSLLFTWAQGTPGQHELTARATDNAGAISDSNPVVITILPPAPAAGAGLLAEYFNGPDLSGTPVTRVDPQVDFDCTGESPAAGIGAGSFSVRWTGKLQPRATGDGTLVVQAAGGVRLWVNDELLIDQWEEPATSVSFETPVHFEAWQIYRLRLEYAERDDFASVRLMLRDTSYRDSVIPESQLFLPGQNPGDLGIVTRALLPAAKRGVPYQLTFRESRGASPLTWTASGLPAGLTLSESGLLSGTLTEIGTSYFVVRVADDTGSFAEKTFTLEVEFAPGDAPRPVAKILAPAPGVRVPEGGVQLRGTARHPAGIRLVQYSLNDGPWRAARGHESWNITLTAVLGLQAGINRVKVRSISHGGLISHEVGTSFTNVVRRPLVVSIEGKGQITAGFLGTTMREVGQNYTIVAMPAEGFVLAGWEGNFYSPGRTLNFTMTENAFAIARFVPNPFPGRAGRYAGLFQGENDTPETRGFLRAKVTPTGAFTATVRIAGETFRLSGRFDTNGSFSGRLGDDSPVIIDMQALKGRPIKPGYYLSLGFNTEQPGTLYGQLSSAFTYEQSITTAQRALYSTHRPCPMQGRYTMPLSGEVAPGFEGNGYALLKIDANGRAALVGELVDGTAWSLDAILVGEGELPLHTWLDQGSLSGSLRMNAEFRKSGGGPLLWARPENPDDPHFPTGFVARLEAVATEYVPPKPGNPVLDLTQGHCTLSGGGLAEEIVKAVALSSSNLFTITPLGTDQMELTVNPANGLVSGSLILPGSSVRSVLRGVADQRGEEVLGFFLGEHAAGRFELRNGPRR